MVQTAAIKGYAFRSGLASERDDKNVSLWISKGNLKANAAMNTITNVFRHSVIIVCALVAG